MIISASRRTDIPAFHAAWFMERVREGYCLVGNPFNRGQVSRVSLAPEDVDCVVFWTRHGRPLLPHLDELEGRGLRAVFLYTIIGNPRGLDPRCPPAGTAMESFRRLAGRLGPESMTWRYDPVVLAPALGADWHKRRFAQLARGLRGATRRVVFSFMLLYRKAQKRLRGLAALGLEPRPHTATDAAELVPFFAACAADNGMELCACAQPEDFSSLGARASRCIDPAALNAALGLRLPLAKDPGQRPECGCAPSKDIGAYDSCGFGCAYCYATSRPPSPAELRRARRSGTPGLGPGFAMGSGLG
jgi:hypothetical protein